MTGPLEQLDPTAHWAAIREALAAARRARAAYVAADGDDALADDRREELLDALNQLGRVLCSAEDAGLLTEIAEYLAVTYGGRP